MQNEELTKFKRPDREWTKQKPGYPKVTTDPAYQNDVTRQVWSYLNDHEDLGLYSGWMANSVLNIKDNDTHKSVATIDYNHDTDSIDVRLEGGETKSFPFDEATIEGVLMPVINKADELSKQRTETMKKESYYTSGNRDGQWAKPMRAKESFPNPAAYVSYKKGYNDGTQGICEQVLPKNEKVDRPYMERIYALVEEGSADWATIGENLVRGLGEDELARTWYDWLERNGIIPSEYDLEQSGVKFDDDMNIVPIDETPEED